MQLLPLRLLPGQDLRQALEKAAKQEWPLPAFVLAGIGSLDQCRLRFANEAIEASIPGPLEILTLSGSVSAAGAHLHMSVSDAEGRVYGGHVCHGNTIRTTGEVLLAQLPGWSMTREYDAVTGSNELLVARNG